MIPRRILLALLATAAIVVAFLVARHPRTVPLEECSYIYRQYANVEGIEAAFVKDFPINDTISVDVTTLQATTDSAWELLKKDFRIPPPPEHAQKQIDLGEDNVSCRLCSNQDPRKPMDTINIDYNQVLAFSYLYKTVSIFHTQNGEEKKIIIFYNLKLL